MLYTLDAGIQRKIKDFYYHIDGTDMKWEYLGEATGEVAVPAGKRVRLVLNKTSGNDLSGLARLGADDLYDLCIGQTADDRCLPHLASLTGLKVLHFSPEAKLPLFTPQGLKRLGSLKSLERLSAPKQISDAGLAVLADALPHLKALYIGQNQLTDAGLAALSRLAELEELAIGGAKITSDGLAVLAKLPSLHYLDLWGVRDSALQQVRKISSLKTLAVPEAITDIGVAYLGGHPNLEVLSLHNTKVTDRGVAHLTSLPSLKKLDLGKREFDRKNPPITDATTVHLKAIRSLEQLSVRADGLTDTGLANLAELYNLRQLELPIAHALDPKNYLSPYTEKGIEALTRIRSLESLTLGGPGVTDTALSHVGRMTNLRSLMLFGCPIGNAGLARLSALQSLETLTLMIPSEVTISGLQCLNGLGRLSNLRADSLKQDGVALNISQLTQLEYLLLSTGKGAAFQDQDLACLANLKRLKCLQLGGTGQGITDAGMAHLAGLTALDRLVLGGSAVTDRSLAALANMSRLDLVIISGTFTDAGLRHLEGLTGLRSLTIHSANNFSEAAKQRLRDHLPNLYRLTADGDRAVGNAATASAHPKPGTLAPDFTVTTLEGAKFTLSEQRGKVVVLHFWATWCSPCVKGLPAMKTFRNHIKQKYGDRVVLLDLVMDDTDTKLRSLVATHKLATPQARIGLKSKLAASYGVTGAPDDFMIGPDGRILLNRESPEGPGDTERVIDKALGLAANKPASQPMRPVAVRRSQR